MQQKVFLKSLFRYVLVATISTPLIAIVTLILFQRINIQVVILGLMFGLATPGILLFNLLNNFLSFSSISYSYQEFILINSLTPWVILGVLLLKNQKEWITYVELFILLYTLYGALAFVLMMMRGT
jgi:hypothetical protein